MQYLGSVQNLEFEDWPLGPGLGVDLMLEAPRTTHVTGASKRSP